MKSKNQLMPMFFMVLACVVVFTSCKKKETIADPNAKQHNEDVSNTKNESDNENTDINNVLKDVSAFGKTEGIQAYNICGATVDTTHPGSSYPRVTLTFDGTTYCGSPARKRSGVVKVELIQGAKWSDAGAKLRVTHTEYKVTYQNLNNHSLVFNGIKYLTDVNGFNWLDIYFGTSTATIRERSEDITVTFENGNVAHWNCARLSTWGIIGGIVNPQFYAVVEADSINGTRKIDSWGTTRFGTNFTTEMITPWKSGTHCGWWKPTQGKYTSTTDNFSITATASVDQEGNVVTADCGGYGYKLDWNYNSGTATGTVVIPYF